MVTLIPNDMLNITASTDARTLVAPLIPQKHGGGLTSETIRSPVGKAKPRTKPKGMINANEIPIRTKRSRSVVDWNISGKVRSMTTR